MHILKVLGHLERLESSTKSLYENYSKLFSDDREVSGLFYSLNLNKQSRAELVRYQKRMVMKAPDDFQEVDVDMDAIESDVLRVKAALAHGDKTKLEDAVKLTVRLETDVAGGYYRSVMEQSNPQVGLLLRSLDTESNEQLRNITFFALRHGWVPQPDEDQE
jgi:hypothetical protein